MVLQSCATQIKWHSLRFMNPITTMTIIKMETGLLYTRVDTGASFLCLYTESVRLKPGMCHSTPLRALGSSLSKRLRARNLLR